MCSNVQYFSVYMFKWEAICYEVTKDKNIRINVGFVEDYQLQKYFRRKRLPIQGKGFQVCRKGCKFLYTMLTLKYILSRLRGRTIEIPSEGRKKSFQSVLLRKKFLISLVFYTLITAFKHFKKLESTLYFTTESRKSLNNASQF